MEHFLIAEHFNTQYPIKPSFSGHQTFPFRYTWLKKGVDAVTSDSSIFSSENATVSLGVGKNMVNSIRHWCSVAGLIKIDKVQRSGFIPSELGKLFFSDYGYDPYLDDPATLWLIHWKIATNMNHATSWYWAFNIKKDNQFDRDSFKQEMDEWVTHNKESKHKASDNTLERDINCFIRTYCQSRNNIGVVEDSFDCPLVELNLIAESPDSDYEFQRGEKLTLPLEVFTATLIAFWNNRFNERDSLPFTDILNAPLSPGRIFKLDEDTMTLYLEKLGELTEGAIHYDETADLKQVYRHGDINPMLY